MAGSGMTPALLGALTRGDYVVDVPAVADAIVASGVLVPTQPAHWLPIWTLEDEPAADGDLA
jgi:hypothetical protein